MILYFAYGSNMQRARLEARVGAVEVLGRSLLEEYCHSFTKLGRDGTGKGNITAAPGQIVYGVLYRLDPAQLTTLRRFEGGYRQISIPVLRARERMMAETFQALRPTGPLRPSADYLAYYHRGMREHDVPRAYRSLIMAQAMLDDLLDE